MTSQISGMNKLKNKRTGVLVSFTRLRHVTSPISVKTPPLDSASRVRVMTRCACPTSVTMLSPPPAERPRHRLHFLDAHLPPRVLQEDLVERGLRERDLMDGDLLRVESPQALQHPPAAVGRVRRQPLRAARSAAPAGDRPRQLAGPRPTVCARLAALMDERVGHVIEPADEPEIFTSREFSVDADRLSRVTDDAADLRPILLDVEARYAD